MKLTERNTEMSDIVEVKFATGKPCNAPAKFKGVTSKSRLFVAMLKDGYTPYKIAEITGCLYQQVRGQLITAGEWNNRKAYKKN